MLGNHKYGRRKLFGGEYAMEDIQKLYFQLDSDKRARIHKVGEGERESTCRDRWGRKSTYYEGYYEVSQGFELYQWETRIH